MDNFVEVIVEDYKGHKKCKVSLRLDAIQHYAYLFQSSIQFTHYLGVSYIIKDPVKVRKFLSLMKQCHQNDSTYYRLEDIEKIGDEFNIWNLNLRKEDIKNYSVTNELWLEIFMDNGEKYLISDQTSIHTILSAYTITPKDFNNLKDEVETLQDEVEHLRTKIGELENALKYAPLGIEYDKSKQHFEEIAKDK